MGNDGGSIPTRRELVKEAARNPSASQLKESQREHLEHFWSTCPLSHKQLLLPIVSDALGNLYNKDAVLRFLLPGGDSEGISAKSDCDEMLRGRVKSIRDVVEVKFELATNGQNSNEKDVKWICPVTNKELGPSVKSVYLVPCGHAFSEQAVREMKSDKCLQCNESYEPKNVVTILPVKEDEKERLKRRMQDLSDRGLTHCLKKAPGSKKRKKNGTTGAGDADPAKPKDDSKPPAAESGPPSCTATPISASSSRVESRTSTPAAASGIKNAATAMLTARVLGEENERNKKRKVVERDETYKSLFSSDQKGGKGKDGDFMTRGFSI